MFLKALIEKQNFNLKKKFGNAGKLDLKGVNLAVTHFKMHFTHVFRHFRVQNKNQNTKKIGKTVMKIWSQKLTKRTSFALITHQKLWTLLLFLVFSCF